MALLEKHCIACKKDTPALSRERAVELCKEIPGWGMEDEAKCLIRSFRFKNFAEALEFVCAVAVIAEKEKHHPDITFGWGYATILLSTHSIKGLHENDFIMAAKINQLTVAS